VIPQVDLRVGVRKDLWELHAYESSNSGISDLCVKRLGAQARMVERLYRDTIVVDSTAPMSPFPNFQTTVGPDEVLEAYERAGLSFVVFTVSDDYPNSIEHTVKLLGQNRQYFLRRSARFSLIESAAEVRKAKMSGKMAVAFSFQGSGALMGELSLVEVYRKLGVIQMLLAYNAGNLVADGCHERRNAGLTQFGRQLVAEMNRVGVIVDVTHVGVRSSLEAMELTIKPPVFSHSTPKQFAPHDRNITDEQIRACAVKDGFIGLTGLGLFMDRSGQKATVSKFVDTIEYVAQLVGPRHAGIGLDYVIDRESLARYIRCNPGIYGEGQQYPADGYIEFLSPSNLPDVAAELSRRGYSDSDVRGILGENYLRVVEANQ
jgi:membrane dipeptidase